VSSPHHFLSIDTTGSGLSALRAGRGDHHAR
jgi:hypothetical protein